MRFIVVHKVTSYLMVLTSFVALFASGEIHPALIGLLLLAYAGSWWWEPPRVDPSRYERLWNALTLIMLSKTVVDIVLSEPVLLTGAWFIIFLTVNKLFNRVSSRDYLQLYVVSFLQMVAATALSTELVYGVLFLFYIVFTTWTLILFHLKREMEENYLLKYGDSLQGRPVQVQRVLNSRKLVGGRFLLATSAVSLAVFVGAATFFFIFPRIGFRFLNQQRPGIKMSGFSDTLELGHFGVIKDDPTVVMRVEFDDPRARFKLPPRWRGIAFDHYDGKTWTKSAPNRRFPIESVAGLYRVRPSARPDDDRVMQSIYLEPMEARVLFGLSRLTAFALDAPELRLPGRTRSIQLDREGDAHYEQADELAFRYQAFSEPEGLPAGLTEQPLAAYRQSLVDRGPDARRYVQLPELDPRVVALAREIIGDASTVAEAAQRVEDWLRTELDYTLELGRDERYAPLDDFLFVQRAGHCEYFSTAMVILLRSQGIGARNVNGFSGGTWNAYGNYLAISQGDAHSWVEVYFPHPICDRRGECQWFDRWQTHDPTPSSASPLRSASAWFRIQQYADALRMRWYKYVIEYDLEQQLGALLALRDLWRSLGSSDEARKPEQQRTRTHARWILVGLIASGALLGLVSLAWRRRRPNSDLSPATPDPRSAAAARLYSELLRAYQERGVTRPPTMTAREFVEDLRRRNAPGQALSGEIVDAYEAIRFGGTAPGAGQLEALTTRLARFKRRADDHDGESE